MLITTDHSLGMFHLVPYNGSNAGIISAPISLHTITRAIDTSSILELILQYYPLPAGTTYTVCVLSTTVVYIISMFKTMFCFHNEYIVCIWFSLNCVWLYQLCKLLYCRISSNILEVSMALVIVCKLIGAEMIPALLPLVRDKMKHPKWVISSDQHLISGDQNKLVMIDTDQWWSIWISGDWYWSVWSIKTNVISWHWSEVINIDN